MPAQNERLFFALRPPPEALAALHALTQAWRAAGVLRGRWTDPSKYHITSQFLGTFARVPDEAIARAQRAAEALRAAPFEIALDRLSSFSHRRAAPCILLATASSDAVLQAFWRGLGAVLAAHGLHGDDGRPYVPHLTVAYGELRADIALDPVRWRAREFCLIRSRIDAGRHEELARWPLSASA